jgi:hypothetical protein
LEQSGFAMLRTILTTLALLLCGSAALAQASPPSQPGTTLSTPRSSAGSYYVEFRVADMGVYGHSYIAYGRLAANGRPASVQYADFHPRGGGVGLAVGHVVPVAAGMLPDPDVLKLPLNAVWRRPLSGAEYKKLTDAVAAARANPKVWSAIAYNCNSFVGDMAEALGLKAPPALLFSNAYIPALIRLNNSSETPQTASRPAPRSKRSQAAPRPNT